MNFLHPEFLWLAPLVSAPILIHLLNRIRYRRQRWAAIEFLLNSDRRAVRRARLRQLLLMAMRTLLLAAALGVLAQPILRGGLAALLGTSRRVAILVDSSASMSATDASGSAFDHAKKLAIDAVGGMRRNARAIGGTFTVDYRTPFREPLQDHGAVRAIIESAAITQAPCNVPRAIATAAALLQRGGGGGTIWLVTDLQAAGWRSDDSGAWAKVRQALKRAGGPKIVVTDVAPHLSSNLFVADLRVSPAILVENDAPRLTAAVGFEGEGGTSADVALFLDGQRIDSCAVQFAEPGRADCVFNLPPLSKGLHTGRLELNPDALPADDRFHFILRTATDVPLLVIDGAPSRSSFEGAADFLSLALRPSGHLDGARSPFAAKRITLDQLGTVALSDFAAVFVVDVPRLTPEQAASLRQYVERGGLAVFFPGSHTDVPAWNARAFPAVRIKGVVEPEGDKPIKIAWASPNHPLTASLPREGLDRVAISRMFSFDTDAQTQALLATDNGNVFLLRSQVGKGKVYTFAVSCQLDYSTLPFTPVFLLTIHRAVLAHLVEARESLADSAAAELRLELPGGARSVRTPDGRMVPLEPQEDGQGQIVFAQTELAGIYELVEGSGSGAGAEGVPVAALNVPPEESQLARIEPGVARGLLAGSSVSFTRGAHGTEQVAGEGGARVATSTFPLAALALALLLGEVLLGWSIGRPRKSNGASQTQPTNGSQKRAAASSSR